ncbi:MAG: hypothetical protein LC808_31360, partial [Actinobacteria bacterium]|nr:hypothetical protein [Actinomycetota bacterium]
WAVTDGIPGVQAFVNGGPKSDYYPLTGGAAPREVAIDGESVWVFSSANQQVYRLPLETTKFPAQDGLASGFDGFPVKRLADSPNDDLAAGEGAVWLTQGGMLARIDPRSLEITNEIDLPGNYAAITTGGGYVWAMSADSEDDTDDGWLTEIDPETGEAIGEPLTLHGKPADIVVGAGAVWVTQTTANTVTRIELQRETPIPDVSASVEPSPDASPTPENNAATEYPLFVFASEGDIWGQYANHFENLTHSSEIEANPTISTDAHVVIFERRKKVDGESTVVQMDLGQAGAEGPFFPGKNPSIGPNNMLAWSIPPGTCSDCGPNGPRPPSASIGTSFVGSVGQSFVPISDPGQPMPIDVSDVAWSADGRHVLYVSSYEGEALEAVDIVINSEGTPRPTRPHGIPARAGAVYVAPSGAFADNAVEVCCSSSPDDPYSQATFGQVGAAGSFREVQSLDDLPVAGEGPFTSYGGEGLGGWYTGFLGHVDRNSDDEWVKKSTKEMMPLWFFGNGEEVWFISETKEKRIEPFESPTGSPISSFAAPNELYR